MAHLSKWVPQLVISFSLILPAGQVLADPPSMNADVSAPVNTFFCPVSSTSSSKMAVIIPDSVLSELATQLKKKKGIATNSVQDAATWVTQNTSCHQTGSSVKVGEICIESTYQCAFDLRSETRKEFVGQYHGILTLTKADLNDLTSGWESVMSHFRKDGVLGTKIHDSLRDIGLKTNFIPDYVRPVLNDGTRQYPDPWTTSKCLQDYLRLGGTSSPAELKAQQKEAKRRDDYEKSIQKNQANPGPFVKHEQQALTGEALALATYKNNHDELEELCGEREGEIADQAKEEERAIERAAAPKPVSARSDGPVDFPPVPGCLEITANSSHFGPPSAETCSLAEACVEKIFKNTCSCDWQTCRRQYRNFCADKKANCLISGDGGQEGTSPRSVSRSLPSFDMAGVTKRALDALNQITDSDTLNCGLRREKKRQTSGVEDTETEKSLAKGCRDDRISLRYLKTILQSFNDDANGVKVTVDYSADASFETLSNLKSFVAVYASGKQGLDPELKASLLEISQRGNFLDWAQRNEGGKNYLGHSHVAATTQAPSSLVDFGVTPLGILNSIDESEVSCINKYGFKTASGNDLYFKKIKFDYAMAFWMDKYINKGCKNLGSAPNKPKAKTSGTAH